MAMHQDNGVDIDHRVSGHMSGTAANSHRKQCVLGSEMYDPACMVQACANSFTMFLGGIVLNALTSSVVQNIPFTVLSDLLPPEQLG